MEATGDEAPTDPTDDHWKCDCTDDYVHHRDQFMCSSCGVTVDDNPACATFEEVEKWKQDLHQERLESRTMTYTIRKLEWERDKEEDENYYYAHPSGGLSRWYEVYLHFQSEVDSVWQMYYDNNREGLYHTLEAAKQAAQSHWESRLKEALEETT